MASDTVKTLRPDWDELRRAMPVARQWAYFDHAAVAPISQPARDVLIAWSQDLAENGDVNWNDWAARLADVRERGAALIGADPSEIALVRNTTEGINLVAEGFPWREGDNCITLADEFPSNQYPWMNLASRGVECRRVAPEAGRVDLAAIERACDARTRVVAISWVNFAHGWRNDLDALADLAHRRGALLFVDAIQALGVFPLDVGRTRIDFLAADGHKWLLGPEGAGLFYVRREHLDLLRPLGVGWNSVRHDRDYNHIELTVKDTAARYEGGTYNMPGLQALGASLDLLAQYKIQDIAERLLEITDDACRRLEAIGARVVSHREPERASGIVAFEMPTGNPLAIKKRLLAQQVVVSCRAGRLRISPHAYTNGDDLDRLIDALRRSE